MGLENIFTGVGDGLEVESTGKIPALGSTRKKDHHVLESSLGYTSGDSVPASHLLGALEL